MEITRKEFFSTFGLGAAAVALPGCICRPPVKDGVQWYVVECERHVEDLSAVLPSYRFLKAKGLN